MFILAMYSLPFCAKYIKSNFFLKQERREFISKLVPYFIFAKVYLVNHDENVKGKLKYEVRGGGNPVFIKYFLQFLTQLSIFSSPTIPFINQTVNQGKGFFSD